MNPVLLQLLLFFTASDDISKLVNAPKDKTWYNSVFNPEGARDVPILFEVEIMDDKIYHAFWDRHGDNIVEEFGTVLVVG